MTGLKQIVANFICGGLATKILRSCYPGTVPNIRYPGMRFDIPLNECSVSTPCEVFWGIYESAEIRFIESYLNPNQNVIELGGSLGVVSSHIARKLSNGKRLIVVEANPNLIAAMRSNLLRNKNPQVETSIVNKAIASIAATVDFELTNDHTTNRVVSNESARTTTVPAVSLSTLIREYQFSSFSLCCDIEGAELDLIINDSDAFRDCTDFFVELHPVTHEDRTHSIIEIENMVVEKLRFRIGRRYGPVYWFTRRT